MLPWLIIAAVLLAVEAVAIVVLWQQARLTRRTTEQIVDLDKRVTEVTEALQAFAPALAIDFAKHEVRIKKLEREGRD